MLFNTVGYRFAFSFLEERSITKLDLAIDAGKYDEKNLIEITIPLNMPYVSDKDYETAYGETEIDGTNYQYVKRKITNNVLHLMCLANNEKTTLVATKHSIEKNTVEAANNKSDKKYPTTSLSKSLQQEYVQNNIACLIYDDVLSLKTKQKITNTKAGNLFKVLTPSQPPENCV